MQSGNLQGVGKTHFRATLVGSQVAHAWKEIAKALLKLGQLAQVVVMALAFDQGFYGGVASP
jgi:hypothetical protein